MQRPLFSAPLALLLAGRTSTQLRAVRWMGPGAPALRGRCFCWAQPGLCWEQGVSVAACACHHFPAAGTEIRLAPAAPGLPLGQLDSLWCRGCPGVGQGSDVSQHQCMLVSMQHLYPGSVLGPGYNQRGCPDHGSPCGQASDRSTAVPPSLCRVRPVGPGVGGWEAAGSNVTCSGWPGLALFPLVWLVMSQAVGLQLLRGFAWHFCWRLAVTVKVGSGKS